MKRTHILLGAFVALLVALSVQGIGAQGDDELEELLDGYTFRSIEAIIEGSINVESFANDGSAQLPVLTTVPVACSVVYGTTEDFGAVSVDQDMAGGAHTDHNPLLTGLEPETTYYFRLQGIDAAGVLYLSDVMTFTTPAFEEPEVENLLSPEMGAEIVGYSSAFGGASPNENWGVLSAFDGSQNTAWSSDGDGNDAWVEVELAQRSRLERVEFWTRSMSNDTAQIFAFTITTGEGDTYGPFELPDAAQLYTFDVDIVAETLRFDVVESNGGNTGAVEIAVYGEPVAD